MPSRKAAKIYRGHRIIIKAVPTKSGEWIFRGLVQTHVRGGGVHNDIFFSNEGLQSDTDALREGFHVGERMIDGDIESGESRS